MRRESLSCAKVCADVSFFLVLRTLVSHLPCCYSYLSGFSSSLSLSLGFLFSPLSNPLFILPLSRADSHRPVLVANAELSGCDNILRSSSCHRFIELLK